MKPMAMWLCVCVCHFQQETRDIIPDYINYSCYIINEENLWLYIKFLSQLIVIYQILMKYKWPENYIMGSLP